MIENSPATLVGFAAHAEFPKTTVFDLPKHRLDDDFALFVNRSSRGCLHFAVHVLPPRLFVIGCEEVRAWPFSDWLQRLLSGQAAQVSAQP